MAERIFNIESLSEADKKRLGIPTNNTGPGVFQQAGTAIKRGADAAAQQAKRIQQNAQASDVIVDPNDPRKFQLRNPEVAQQVAAQNRGADPKVNQPPATTGVPDQPTNTAADPAVETNRIQFLEDNGVNAAARGQDPSQFNVNPALRGQTIRGEPGGANTTAIRTPELFRGVSSAIGNETPVARIGQEALTNTRQVNLGSFGVEGGPNIFGEAPTEPGGRINTFTGAGTPIDDTSVVNGTDADAIQRAQALRGAGPSATPNIANRAFRGGAGSGGGTDILRQVRAINQRANSAFNQALEQGLNTKAASRIAANIREGGEQLISADQNLVNRDRTDAIREGTAANIASDERIAALRAAGDQAKLNAEQEAAFEEASLEDLRGLSTTFNEDTGEYVFDPRQFSEALFAAGGRDGLRGLSGTAKHALFRQGSNVTKLLSNVNRFLAADGRRVDNIADLLKGAQLTGSGRLAQSDTTFLEALRSKNIDITEIFGQTLRLGDGTLLPLGDIIGPDAGGASLTADERAALIEILDED